MGSAPGGTAVTRKRAALGATVGVLVLCLGYVVAAVPAILIGKEDPKAECASAYAERKAELVDATWHWFPPSWTCRFEATPNGRVP